MRHVQPPLQLYPTPLHLYPPPSNFTSPTGSPSRKVAGLGWFSSLALAPTLSGPHPSAFLWCRSPRAGVPLRTGRVAGGSTRLTAEAGKLPTLNVRPFWPFQVVESRLWEEARVKGAGSQGRVGLGPGPHSVHKLCATEPHLPGGRDALFSLTQKGSMGQCGSSGEARTVVECLGL